MAKAAERMKAMGARRRNKGLRELRLTVTDARSKAVRRRVARQVATLDSTIVEPTETNGRNHALKSWLTN
jgi:hypothetical protein